MHDPPRTRRRTPERVTVLCADAHPVYRDGLARAVKERPDLELVGLVDDGRAALDEVGRLRPQVAVIDHDLGRLDGMQVLTAVIRDELPTRIVFLSARLDSQSVYGAIAAGAAGYIAKEADRQQICDAIVAVTRGQTVLSPRAQLQIAGEIESRWSEDEAPLTSRERDVLRLIAEGHTVNQVAERLDLTRATVKTHLQHLYEKLGVSSQAAAVAEAMRRRLIE